MESRRESLAYPLARLPFRHCLLFARRPIQHFADTPDSRAVGGKGDAQIAYSGWILPSLQPWTSKLSQSTSAACSPRPPSTWPPYPARRSERCWQSRLERRSSRRTKRCVDCYGQCIHALTRRNPQAIDSLIIDAFNRIATAAGATTAPAAPPQQQQQANARNTTQVDSNGNVVPKQEHHPGSTASAPNGSSGNHRAAESSSGSTTSKQQRDRQKQQQPEESEASDDDEDASASESEPEPKRQQHLKQSPQKKKITSSAAAAASSAFPASSPNVPLSIATTALTDEEYARKLQEEFNNLGGGRSTRNTGSRTTSKKAKRGKSSTSKASAANGTSKRYRSKAYIDDSDLDGEEGHDGSDDNDDADSDVPKKKKRKTGGGGGGGGTGGGYNKELALSEPLQKVCGVPTVSFHTVSLVKRRPGGQMQVT